MSAPLTDPNSTPSSPSGPPGPSTDDILLTALLALFRERAMRTGSPPPQAIVHAIGDVRSAIQRADATLATGAISLLKAALRGMPRDASERLLVRVVSKRHGLSNARRRSTAAS
jgi:hypothetical protein